MRPDRPRLLLFSYHFPPSSATGALRWEMLSRLASERGLDCDVLTLHPDELREPDLRRLDGLPPGIRVFGVRPAQLLAQRVEAVAWELYRRLRPRRPLPHGSGVRATEALPESAPEPGSFARAEVRFAALEFRSWTRAYHAWLEAHRDLAWGHAAGKVARALAGPGTHAAVVSCGPPHMPHAAAAECALALRLPYVMDMRDPWRLQQRLIAGVASPVWYRLAVAWEERCVRAARLVVTNTDPFREQMQALYPSKRDRVITVMNGFDEDPVPSVPRDPRFLIAYAGSIYLDRDPRPLLRAGARLIAAERLMPQQIGFAFIGNTESYGGIPVRQIAAEEGISDYVSTGPARPRAEAHAFMASATLLVSLPQDSDLAIPSKIFEYLNFEAWVLALARQDSATGRAVAGTSIDLADPDDVGGIYAVIARRWREFNSGQRPSRRQGVAHLSRRHQAKQLFDRLLADLATGRQSARA